MTNNASNPHPSPRKVLIVDDQLDIIKLIESLLTRKGYETFTATSGFEAGVWLSHISPDVMTLDLNMPNMDGREVLAIYKKLPLFQKTKILIVSGRPEEEMKVLLDQGAHDYIAKPFKKEDFLQKIQDLIQKN